MSMLPFDAITILCGDIAVLDEPGISVPFDAIVCLFLECFSQQIMQSLSAKRYPDLVTFAFWLRRANLQRLQKQYQDSLLRLGLGLVFHVTPGNVPVNSLYSLAFGLLAGNANVVRLPSTFFAQLNLACEILNDLLCQAVFIPLRSRILCIQYAHDATINRRLSDLCDARIVWGGDDTIQSFRQFPIPVRAREIHFADRTSFCVVHADSLLLQDQESLARIAEGFYNDTYLMDQNACSSPHVICWTGSSQALIADAQQYFWNALKVVVLRRYPREPLHGSEKLLQACKDAVLLDELDSVDWYDEPLVFRAQLRQLPIRWVELRGRYGYFYECMADEDQLVSILKSVTTRVQTLTCFGYSHDFWRNILLKHRVVGIDRIVSIGSALDMDLVWDGYLLISELSRVVDIR